MNVNFLRTVHEVDFIVKEDEGIVVARVSDPSKIPNELVELTRANYEDSYSAWARMKVIHQYHKYVATMRGVAKCDAKDEFDVDTGKKIAFLKLRRKYNKYLARIINAEVNAAEEKIENLQNTLSKIAEISIRDTMNLRTYGTVAEEVYPN